MAGDDAFSPVLKVWIYPTDEQLQDDTESNAQVRPPVDISWFNRLMEPASGPLKPADLMPVIAGLTNLLKANYFAEIDRLLKSVKVSDAAPEMLVALLRTTYPARHKLLRHWLKLLRDVRAEFADRHLDGERILRGLI
ncbi:hypothetical protein E4P82_17365 [Candidatus Competibacter phosphatis]|uniref:Uncharacterized protein n=2 Tax=Candidatus Competibacter phosphatis TaxID=221280 RepID=A0ABX1TQ66_9GAMM|nr:hypothetical protein [Candidatus Competibacter phosphatis]